MYGNYNIYTVEGYTEEGSLGAWCLVFFVAAGDKTLVAASRGVCDHATNQQMIKRITEGR